jgi:hypothetical protein
VGGRARGDRRWLSFCITEMKKASQGPDVQVVQGQSSHQGMAGEVPSRGYAIVMLGSSCFTRHALLVRVHHLLSSSKEKNICIKFPTVIPPTKHLAYLLFMSWECVIEHETLYIVLLFRARCTMKTSLTNLRSLRNLSSPDIRVPSSDHLQSPWLSSHH